MNLLHKINSRFYPQRIFFPPEWLVLGVNNICNLHCKMCDVGTQYQNSTFYQNLMGSHPINMPLELIKRVVDQASSHFPRVKIGYAFTEPLIYPHLIESLGYADQRNLYTSITTNALNLKHKALDLIDAGLDEIFISLDGPPEIHNKIRGHKSSFQRAMEGMELFFSKEKHPEVSVFCVITQWNIGHLQDDSTERQIAQTIRRSPHTNHVHVKNIYRKLGINSLRMLTSLLEIDS